jgi:hypothetical protein
MGVRVDARVLFLVRVADGRLAEVLRRALAFEAIEHGATAGNRELLLFASGLDAGRVGVAARTLADLDGVEAVTCTAAAPLPA